MELRKATRQKAKLRIGVTAPSGAGKTYSSLLLARGLASAWDKIAVIDTENGSGELYTHLGDYNVMTLEAPYTPERYIEAIRKCESGDMDVIVIDSATHEWDGTGGCLEIYEQLGGRYQDWAKVTPRHRNFLEAILASKCHIVTTTRRKQDYEMNKDSSGKIKVEKVGLKEVQRDGYEYELTLNFELDTRHNASASKDRTGLFVDKPEFIITEETGRTLKEWSEQGIDSSEMKAREEAMRKEKEIEVTRVALKNRIIKLIKELGFDMEKFPTPEEKKVGITAYIKKHTSEELNDDIENLEIIVSKLVMLVSEKREYAASQPKEEPVI